METFSHFPCRMVRKAGAAQVHFRVASPPVISPCFYGMDFPSREELLSYRYPTAVEMGKALGAVRVFTEHGLLSNADLMPFTGFVRVSLGRWIASCDGVVSM